MKRVLLSLFFFLTLSFVKSIPLDAKGYPTGISISAAIGQRFFTLNGYTSPQSKVFLDTDTLHLQTISETSGYFAFPRQIIDPTTREICLYSINSQNQHSATVCVPPPPPGRYFTHIGPILLPPTLTLSSSTINPNSTTTASG